MKKQVDITAAIARAPEEPVIKVRVAPLSDGQLVGAACPGMSEPSTVCEAAGPLGKASVWIVEAPRYTSPRGVSAPFSSRKSEGKAA